MQTLVTTNNPELQGEEIRKYMTRMINRLRIWKDTRGQDLIEYALMAGFVAVAAGAIMPNIATAISTIFAAIKTQLDAAAVAVP